MERDENVPEWEKSKENVQPRKHGRIVGKLNAGLCARTEMEVSSKLKSEKEAYETALRSYEGDDPLSVWYNYINWTEENFPTGGKTTRLQDLLTSCVKQFEKSDQYRNDERFIQIWITFASKCKEPCEVYKHMNSKKIGMQSAAFYKAWALATEALGQPKRADKIFVQGINIGAEPRDTLKRAREEFETRTCRSLMENMSNSADEPLEDPIAQRKTLVPLTSTGVGRVPHDRVAAARPTQTATCTLNSSRLTVPQKSVQVFVDENGSNQPCLDRRTAVQAVLPDVKENTCTAGKWTNPPSRSHRSHTFSQPSMSTDAAQFEVHADVVTSAPQLSHTTTVGAGLGLSVKKADKKGLVEEPVPGTYVHNAEQFIQEIPMYDKHKVYAGVTEYSFEELRALKWQKEEDKKREEKDAVSLLRRQQDLLEAETETQLGRISEARRQLTREISLEKLRIREELKAELLAQVVPSIETLKGELLGQLSALRSELRSVCQQDTGRVEHKLELFVHKLDALEQTGMLTQPGTQRDEPPPSEPTPALIEQTTSQASALSYKTPNDKSNASIRVSSVSFKRHRTPDSSCAKRSLIKHSPFSVTQDCAKLLNGFLNQTLAVGNAPPSTTAKESTQESLTQVPPADRFQIYADPKPKPSAPFTIFTDKEEDMAIQVAEDESDVKQSLVTGVCTSTVTELTANPCLVPSTHVSASTEPSAFSAFTRPLNTAGSKPELKNPSAASFAVFTDEQSYIQERDKPSTDQENVPAAREVPSKCRLLSETGSLDSQTDYEIRANFSQQSRAVSTPFDGSAKMQVSDIGVSEIKQQPKSLLRPSINPIDFAPTQLLSPITERSQESTSSSRSAVSSDGSNNHMGLTNNSGGNMYLTKMGADMTRTRCQSGGSDGEVGENHSEYQLAQNKSKAPHSVHCLDMVREESGEILERATPVIDTTLYNPPELTEAQLNTTVFIDASNPFSEAIQAKLLRKIDISSYPNVEMYSSEMPKYKVGSKILLDRLSLKIVSKIGQGGFASTYKAVITDRKAETKSIATSDYSTLSCINSCSTTNPQPKISDTVCVKVQRPPCPWELYICKELKDRMDYMDSDKERDIMARVMHVSHAAFFSNGSLMVNDLVSFGTLLNLANGVKGKQQKMPESLVMYITIELLHTIEVLHRCKIIHGDIKPDNVLFMGFPEIPVDEKSPYKASSIKLIDFGRSIDLSKFAAGTTFTANNETEGFMCIEMKTERPWTYQTDLFGLLGTIFPLICFTYMPVDYKEGRWKSKSLPRAYQSKLWEQMFDEFLNIPSCDEIPDVASWRERFEEEFMDMLEAYRTSRAKVNSLLLWKQ